VRARCVLGTGLPLPGPGGTSSDSTTSLWGCARQLVECGSSERSPALPRFQIFLWAGPEAEGGVPGARRPFWTDGPIGKPAVGSLSSEFDDGVVADGDGLFIEVAWEHGPAAVGRGRCAVRNLGREERLGRSDQAGVDMFQDRISVWPWGSGDPEVLLGAWPLALPFGRCGLVGAG
jgi:hypothetical protein